MQENACAFGSSVRALVLLVPGVRRVGGEWHTPLHEGDASSWRWSRRLPDPESLTRGPVGLGPDPEGPRGRGREWRGPDPLSFLPRGPRPMAATASSASAGALSRSRARKRTA